MHGCNYILLSKDGYLRYGLESIAKSLSLIRVDSGPFLSVSACSDKQLILFIDSRFPGHFIDLWTHIYSAIYSRVHPVILNLSGNQLIPSDRDKSYFIDAHLGTEIFTREIIRVYNMILDPVDTVDADDLHEVKLTPREKCILYHSMKGLSVHRIAEIYQCSEKSVYSHRNNIVKKFGFNSFNKLYGYLLKNRMLYKLLGRQGALT